MSRERESVCVTKRVGFYSRVLDYDKERKRKRAEGRS